MTFVCGVISVRRCSLLSCGEWLFDCVLASVPSPKMRGRFRLFNVSCVSRSFVVFPLAKSRCMHACCWCVCV